nr:ComEC/Rec2 family competence protein [Histidinibacterium lentulum]
MGVPGRLTEALLAQRPELFCWLPVGLGLGIGIYFSLGVEPGGVVYALCAALVAGGAVMARLPRPWLSLVGWAVLAVAGGVLVAGARSNAVAEPVLGFRYYGPIEGRIVAIDRSASDALRLTLDRVVLERVPPGRTPMRVRVSLHGEQGWIVPEPGLVVITTGHLSPPSRPVEPGGFDFRRMAWFDRLGAVGYTRSPVLMLSPPEGDPRLWVYRQRMAVSHALQSAMGAEAGAFAAAVTTGDRSAIPADALQSLRDSNLAHLLAISGLHMGLLVGFVFGAVRYGLALWPWVALRLDTRRVAAAVALVCGAGYLLLSGGSVATERAYIMVAVMLIAILAGRLALTLRAVAVAAVLVLLRRPEELAGPGFQMSFAATAALVAVFGALRGRSLGPRWLARIGAVVLSSFVAGLATAPFAAAHFNQIAHYGLIANVLSVPVMGAVVMPAAVLAACAAPLGLAGPALWVMERGILWILTMADWVAGLDGAVGHVVSPGPAVLPLVTAAGLWAILWQGRGRLAGAVPLALAAWLWSQAERPDLLVAESGALVGLMTSEGRALSKPRGDGFAAGIWLENDGAPVSQEVAHALGAMERGRPAALAGLTVLHVTGQGRLDDLEDCGGADILVTDGAAGTRPCLVLDAPALRRTGAVAGWLTETGGLRLVSVAETTGTRLWSPEGTALPLPAPEPPGHTLARAVRDQ